MIPEIRIEEYNYNLPDCRIAKYPLEERDSSKLLVYKQGQIEQTIFKSLATKIDSNSIMVFNDTKVVPARLFFRRSTGAHIEVFCLEPINPIDYNQCFASTKTCTWRCVIGNAKRLKQNEILICDLEDKRISQYQLSAKLLSRQDQVAEVEFNWNGGELFSNILELCGNIPIPPYLNRNTEQIDIERYQTLYAHIRGSVAAPTAGLHFSDKVLSEIKVKGVDIQKCCLHVGAGTFLPVKSSLVSQHQMHREPFVVSLELLKTLQNKGSRRLIAVGTTSIRTLESLYYAGVSCIENGEPKDISQWEAYEREYTYSTNEALSSLINYLETNNLKELKLGTRIIIVPSFQFRIVDMLITNFHQPQSTLLLLISAFVGEDWNKIYDYALNNDFRFLSYGDSSLLYRYDL